MSARRLLRIFAHATLIALRDSVLDFQAAMVPAIQLVIDEIEERASAEEEARARVVIVGVMRQARQEQKLWN